MDVSKLKKLIEESGFTKQSIADNCKISRPTLDNLLNGSDAKISTVESLSAFFKIPVGYFFADDVNQTYGDNSVLIGGNNNGKINMEDKQNLDKALSEIKFLKAEIDSKNMLLEEKERLISVLMKK